MAKYSLVSAVVLALLVNVTILIKLMCYCLFLDIKSSFGFFGSVITSQAAWFILIILYSVKVQLQ